MLFVPLPVPPVLAVAVKLPVAAVSPPANTTDIV